MITDDIDVVPVVDERGKLIGIITAADMTAAIARWGVTARM
jgi:CBS domain-containing protein